MKARRPPIKLEAIGILPGSVLSFSHDRSVIATVLEGGRLEFEGEVLSPSVAALKALHRMGYQTPKASGSRYWMFEGELLDERRRRIEAERFDVTGPQN